MAEVKSDLFVIGQAIYSFGKEWLECNCVYALNECYLISLVSYTNEILNFGTGGVFNYFT